MFQAIESITCLNLSYIFMDFEAGKQKDEFN
jgi:hypothetical protein